MLCCLDRMARGAETEENWLHLESGGECALTSTNWVDKAAVCRQSPVPGVQFRSSTPGATRLRMCVGRDRRRCTPTPR